jgi:hypothetical protein
LFTFSTGGRAAQIMLLITALSAAAPAALSGETKVEIDSRLDTEGDVRHRVLFLNSRIGVFTYLEEQPGTGPEYRFGFATPGVVFGPAKYFGGIRELGNPGGYSAGSGVYSEAATMRLCRDMSAGDRAGVSLRTRGKEFGIGGTYNAKTGQVDGGVWGNLFPGSIVSGNAVFFTTYNQKKSLAEETWISDTPPALPRTVLHLYGNLRLQTDRLFVSAAAGLSGSKISGPGPFVRGHASLSLPFLHADAAAAFIWPDYLTPDGTRPKKAFTAAGEALLLPRFPFRLRGGYGKRIDAPHIFPEMYIPGDDKWFCAAEVETGVVDGKLRWDCKQYWDSLGTLSGEEEFYAELTLFPEGPVRVTGGCSYSYDETGTDEIAVPVSVTVNTSDVRISIRTEIYRREAFSAENSFRLELKGRRASAFLLAEADIIGGEETAGAAEMGKLYLQFGWSITGFLSPIRPHTGLLPRD